MSANSSRSRLNRKGQALGEYATLVAFVGAGLVLVVGSFGRQTQKVWEHSASQFADAPSPAPGGWGGGAAGGGGGTPSAGSPAPSSDVGSTPPGQPPEDPAADPESPDSVADGQVPDSSAAQHASR